MLSSGCCASCEGAEHWTNDRRHKKILSFRLLAGPDAGCAWFVWSLAGSMLALVPLVVAAQRGRNPKRLFVRRSSVLRNSLLADAVGSTILA